MHGPTTNTVTKTLTLAPAATGIVDALGDSEFYGTTFSVHSMGNFPFTVEILHADQVISSTSFTPGPGVSALQKFEVPGVFPANTNVPKLHHGFRVAARVTNNGGATGVFRCFAVFHLNQGAAG